LASSDIIKEKREGEESLVAVGRIVAAHGLKGEIKAVPLTDSPERIFELRSVFVSRDGAGGADRHEIESVRESGRHLLIKLSGVDDRNRAESLRGAWLNIPESERRAPADNAFYPDQLAGLRVETASGEAVGTVTDVLRTRAHDLLAVDREGTEILIPMVKALIRRVDLDSGKVVIDSVEGLF
jgi:16S rRNA processing protein RimM